MKHSTSESLRENLGVRIPKDYPWKVLNTLVDDLRHCFTDSEIIEVKRIIRKRDYAAYLELSEAWGPQGITPDDVPSGVFFGRYQVASLIKKYRFAGDNKARRDAALEKFFAAEDACAKFNQSGWNALATLTDPLELCAFTHILGFLNRLLGATLPDQAALTHWSRHGPGANLDTKDRNTSLYHKYSEWPYSCTERALGHAREVILADERWRGALEDDYRERNNIPKHVIINQEEFLSAVLTPVSTNRITFVPKNSQTDRSIAIEPSMNLYLQLGVDGYIRRRLKRWGVDLDSQTKNQELARIGSLYWDHPRSFVTLDLAAASDSVSTELCRLLLPSQWYAYLMDLRSPNGCVAGEEIKFNKISSMGNGYTFALESAIFAAIVYGCIKAVEGHVNRDEFAVYGDDIIVRKHISDLVVRMLNLCGFNINQAKSFTQGPFRESCGADWFKGTSVRPVFLTEKPSTVPDLWCDHNRIRRVLALKAMEYNSETCKLVTRWIPQLFERFTGPASDMDFSSYLHAPKPSVTVRRHSTVRFSRLVVSYRPGKGSSFFFRKLMHPLRSNAEISSPWNFSTWGGVQVSAAGSVFTITSLKAVVVGVSPSYTDYWCEEYNEQLPCGFYPS
jgi:hypothetical protein